MSRLGAGCHVSSPYAMPFQSKEGANTHRNHRGSPQAVDSISLGKKFFFFFFCIREFSTYSASIFPHPYLDCASEGGVIWRWAPCTAAASSAYVLGCGLWTEVSSVLCASECSGNVFKSLAQQGCLFHYLYCCNLLF